MHCAGMKCRRTPPAGFGRYLSSLHKPEEPEPYLPREFRSPTADARKLREAKRWLKRLGRCRACHKKISTEPDPTSIIKINTFVAEYKKGLTAVRLSGYETIMSL